MKSRRFFAFAIAAGAFAFGSTLRAAPTLEDQNQRAERAEKFSPTMGRGLRTILAEYEGLAPTVNNITQRAAAATRSFPRAQRDSRSRVLVDIYLDGSTTQDKPRKMIPRLGGDVVARVDWYREGLITAWVPLRKIPQLAATAGVSAVHLAVQPRSRVGKTTSQGAVVHKTDLVNSAGFRGSGVTIGVLSDSYDANTTARSYPGFTRASADVTAGDLPGTTNPNGYTTAVRVVAEGTSGTSGTSDEGRAMLQIIHDLAPAAKLAFATCGSSESNFATNIKQLDTVAGCDVICDDIVFPSEPMFSDGVVSQAVDQVSANGVVYFSSAGNDGNNGYAATFTPVSSAVGLTRATAGGVNTSSIASGERNVISQWHTFGKDSNGNAIVIQNVRTGDDTVTLNFQWDDPFDVIGGVTADFDILVFNSSGTYQGSLSGTDSNGSTKEPLELPVTDLSPNTSYKIAIVLTNRVSTSGRKATQLRYMGFTGGTLSGDFITPESPSTFGHCCAATAMGVGAYEYDIIPTTTAHSFKPTVEDFSSNGPVTIYFNSAGKRLATPILRKQPAISAVDGVNTSFFPPSSAGPSANDVEGDGYPNFHGTSAAAPHAAAIAALMIEAGKSKGITLSPADLRTLLIKTAQKSTDQDLFFSRAQSGPVAVTANGDTSNESSESSTFFRVALSNTTGRLTQLSIDLSPVKLHFDEDATLGTPFTIGGVTGSPTLNGDPVVGMGASSTNATGKLTLNFTNFTSGSTMSFGIDRDEDLTNNTGNGADEIGGLTTAGGAKFTAVVDGVTYTGTFFNDLRGTYHYKAGYGLIDAQSAVNAVLGF
jgi:hypothetical protein